MYKTVSVGIWFFVLLSIAAVPAAADLNDGLVAYFKLDETEGTVAADASGNGNDGTLLGAGLSWVEGRDAGALMYTGVDTDGRLEFPTTGMSTSAGSVAVWGYLSDPQPETDGRYFFGHTTQPQFNSRIQLYMQEGSTPSRLLDVGLGSSHTTRTNIVELPMEEWLHVAMTWDNGAYAVYVDGEEVANGTYGGLTALHPVANFGNDGSNAPYEAFGGMLDDARVYNRALTAAEVTTIFQMQPVSMFMAQEPDPADGATDVPVDSVLGWTASEFAMAHDVYFGTSFDDVNAAGRAHPMDVLVSQGQSGTSYDPTGAIDFGQTYYWRIDEVNGAPDNTIFKGQVWSFTAEPLGYPIADVVATTNADSAQGSGPDNLVNGSGLNEADQHSTEATDMWLATPVDEPTYVEFAFDKVHKLHELLVWNYNVQFEPVLGFGVKDVTIETSVDGTEWTILGDAQFARGTATATYAANTAVDLGGTAAQFVRVNINSGWGTLGQYGLSEVRFTYIPVQAREPEPADGAIDVDPATTLSWRAGREAVSHDVYLGTDPNALTLIGSVTDTTIAPDTIGFGTTYYWRIDEVSDAVWTGDVWSFTTLEYVLIDGFETYTDDIEAGEAIFDTWLDGWINETGSIVGYFDAPFAEQTIVNSGGQSMPLQYDNTESPFYSEAERIFDSPQDWTVNGADTLRLFVAGSAPAFVETADGTILMNGVGSDIWNNADEFRYVYKNLSGDGSMVARVDYLDGAPDIWVKGGIMVRQDTDAGAINTFVAMTGSGGGGATFQQRVAADGATVSQHTYDGNPFAAPYWIKLERTGNAFSAFISPDGVTWQQAGETATVAMSDPVLVGLALTSHNVDEATSAEFSNIAFTGNVTGNWQVAEVGAVQPTGNDVAPLYVALEDTSGNMGVVTHPNASIVGRSGWNEWQIPLSDFAGVNLGRVDTMFIGVGNPTNSTAGGSGIIYIDDIGYGKSASGQ